MYTLLYDRRIEKDLRPIPREFRRLILQRIEALAEQPRHPQVEKLTGEEGYRLRVGDYRVLFTIDDRSKHVTIYRIRHRHDPPHNRGHKHISPRPTNLFVSPIYHRLVPRLTVAVHRTHVPDFPNGI